MGGIDGIITIPHHSYQTKLESPIPLLYQWSRLKCLAHLSSRSVISCINLRPPCGGGGRGRSGGGGRGARHVQGRIQRVSAASGGFAEGGHRINNRQLQTQFRILPRSQYSCIVSATCTGVFIQTVFQINSKMSLDMQTMSGGGGDENQPPGHVSTQEVSLQSATITTVSSMFLL